MYIMPEETINQDIYSKYLNTELCEKGLCEIHKKETAIILFHGYAQTSNIYKPYIETLKEYGDVFAPTLTGHFESRIVDIKSYKDLIHTNLEIYKLLKEQYKKIIIVGYSLGGIVSINLASKIKPDKLILISTPINYDYEAFKISVLSLINEFRRIKKNKQEFKLSTYLEMFKLASLARKQLKKIDCDTLLLHGEKDDLDPIEQSYYILSNISSQSREFYMIKNVDHYVLEHYDLVLPKIIEYITRK